MVTLEYGIDVAGVLSGSQNAFQALDRMANSARIATNALEAIGHTGGRITQLGAAIGRLHPYLLAATTLMSGLSLGLSLMGSNADRATKSVDALATALGKARAQQQVAAFLGLSTLPGMKAESSAYVEAMERVSGPISTADFAKSVGVGREDVLRYLSGRGNQNAANILEHGYWWTGANKPQIGEPMYIERQRHGDLTLTEFQQQDFLRRRYEGTQSQIEQQGSSYWSRWGSGFGQATYDPKTGQMKSPGMGVYDPSYNELGRTYAGSGSSMTDRDWYQASGVGANDRRARDEEALRLSRELEQSAQRIGDSFGDAAARLLFGLSSAREIAMQIAFDMTRAGLSALGERAARGLFSGFGMTGPQAEGG